MRRSTAFPLFVLPALVLACSSGGGGVTGASSSPGTASSRTSTSTSHSSASGSSSVTGSSSTSSAASSSAVTESSSSSAPAFDAGSTVHDATVDAPGSPLDAAPSDASLEATGDASGACEVFGAPGECITTTACAAMTAHTSYAGHCPGPATIECCIVTPNTANNPPTPAGYQLMQQSQVTTAMTTWAVMILNDPTDYPMFSTTLMTFGTQTVLARVEWHPPDFQNGVIHRGVTLYVPV